MGEMSLKRDSIRTIVEIFIAYMGAVNIIHTMSACDVLAINVSVYKVLLLIIIAALFKLYKSGIWKIAGLIYPVVCIISTIIMFPVLKRAVLYGVEIMNVSRKHGKYYDKKIHISPTEEQIAAQDIFMLLLCFVAAYLSLLVVKSASMLAAILFAAPLIVAFATFNNVPDALSMVLAVIFVLAVSAFRKNLYGYINVVKIVAVSMVISVVAVVIIQPALYKRPDLFARLGTYINSSVNRLNGLVENESAAMVNNGVIGAVDKVKFVNVTQLKYTTGATGHSQYIPEFYGEQYNADRKRWTEDEETEYTGYLSSDRRGLFLKIRNYSDVSDYIAADEDIGEYIIPYRFSSINLINNESKSGYDAYFSAKAVKAAYKLSAEEDSSIEREKRYDFIYMKLSQSDRDNKLALDKEYEILFRKIFGDVTLDNYDDKMNYINMVKKYFQDNFTYTTEPGKVPADKDFMEYFLLESKAGYCTYYATAATLAFRYAGIPARYVEGWVVSDSQIRGGAETYLGVDKGYNLPGMEEVNQKSYEVDVKDSDAHAWVEVYIDGYGWMTVEVTPYVMNASADGFGDEMDGYMSDESNNSGEEYSEAASEEFPTEDSADVTQTADATESTVENDTLNDTEADIWGEASSLDDGMSQVENGNNIEKGGKNILYILMIIIPMLCLPAGLLVLCIRLKNLKKLYEEGTPRQIVAELEQLMSRTRYVRPQTRDHMDYARYLEKTSSIFDSHNYRQAVELAVKEKFAGGISEEELEFFNNLLRKEMQQLREEIIAEQSLPKQILLKYVLIK